MVKIVTPYGYCSGVNMAIEGAKAIKDSYPDSHVVILGKLVHNNEALEDLKDHDIDIIFEKDKTYEELIKYVKDDDIVILTAHGHTKRVEDLLNERSIKFFDLTCPYVKLTHENILYSINEGHDVIYIGKKNHPEAISALSLSDKVFLYDIEKGLDYSLIKDEYPVIYTQTTFSNLDVKRITDEILSYFPKAKFGKTICHASMTRQDALLKLDKDTELIYVIGSSFSNNTKTLFDLAKEHYPAITVRLIENKEYIDIKDIKEKENIVLISGASTPKIIVDEIKFTIESLLNK